MKIYKLIFNMSILLTILMITYPNINRYIYNDDISYDCNVNYFSEIFNKIKKKIKYIIDTIYNNT